MTIRIPLARPNITQAEIDAVADVLRTPQLSLGPKVPAFEEAIARYCGTKHAVACSSGTAGLHLLVRAMGIGPGDEVITTPFSFVASANCILMEGAKPVFVDIHPNYWDLDPSRIDAAITPRTKAILPVDVFGQIADMASIRIIAERHGLKIIEDSCEALGSETGGRRAGSFGDAGVFGFYPNKQITTGEGGMIVTDDDRVADLCRSMRNQGRDTAGGWLAHARMGYNYRMSDINAALGLTQLSRLREIREERDRVWYQYMVTLPRERLISQGLRRDQKVHWFVLVVCLSDDVSPNRRDEILRALAEQGIGCSNYFVPIHLQPFYIEQFGHKPGDFPVCERVAARTIALPFHHELTEEHVDTVCETLQKLL